MTHYSLCRSKNSRGKLILFRACPRLLSLTFKIPIRRRSDRRQYFAIGTSKDLKSSASLDFANVSMYSFREALSGIILTTGYPASANAKFINSRVVRPLPSINGWMLTNFWWRSAAHWTGCMWFIACWDHSTSYWILRGISVSAVYVASSWPFGQTSTTR